jgi:membrane protease subunit HflK
MLAIFKRIGAKLNLNDNRWGRNPDQDKDGKQQEGRRPPEGGGPPDLDQLWRDFNHRLNRLFGQRPSNGGDGRGDMKGIGITAGAVFAVILLIWLASGAFIVNAGETGVVTTFGKLSHTVGPGFNWRWPYPFQSYQKVNTGSVRNVEIGYRGNVRNKQLKEALMLTDDENIIDIQFTVQYTLKDPVAWLFNNREPEDNVKQVAETAVREVVGRSQMDYVLYEGQEKVARDVQTLVQAILDRYHSGVQIANVSMQGVQPPEQVQGAFEDTVKASQDRKRLSNEGQAYANNVINNAKGKATRLLQEAEGYRSQVIDNATGNAARFNQVVAEYAKAPVVTRDRMYIDTMQQIFSSTSKVMIDAKSGQNLLYLPLDKLVQQTIANDTAARAANQQAAAQQQATQQPQATQPVQDMLPTLDPHRDNVRGRDAARDREGR